METKNVNTTQAQASSGGKSGSSNLWLLLAIIAAAAAWYINFGNHSIVGTWECTTDLSSYGIPDLEMSFGESGDASMTMDGETAFFTYAYLDDTLSFSGGGNSVTITCEVNGNTMTWTDFVSGTTASFTRQ